MQRSQATIGPDRRLIAIAIGLLLALAANVLWIQVSNAEENPGDSLEVSVANFCSGDALAAVLTNTSSEAVDAVVSIDGVETAVTVDAFKTKRVTTPAVEDATYDFIITAGGVELLNETVLRDCEFDSTPDPTIEVIDSCSDGGVVVTITNPAGVAQTVDVLLDRAIVESVTVAPDSSTSVTVALAEDQTAVISTELAGKELSSTTVTHDCETPEPDVTVVDSCVEGGVVITITNPADIDQSVELLVDGTIVETVTVVAMTTETVVVPMTEDQTAQITVRSGNGTVLADESITHDCEEVESNVVILNPCVGPDNVLSIENPGRSDRTFDVALDGTVFTTLTVAAGSTAEIASPFAEDQTGQITVIEAGTVIFDQTFTQDCEDPNEEDPTVTIVNDCAEGGALITVTNDSDVSRVVEVLVDGTVTETLTVNPGDAKSVTIPMTEDQTAQITVRMGNGTVLADESITHDCVDPNDDDPTATIVGDCATGGAVVSVSNTSDIDRRVDILVDATIVESRTVGAGTDATFSVAMEEDQTSTVAVVMGNGTVLAEETITLDCEDPRPPTVTIANSCDEGGALITVANAADEAQTVRVEVDGTFVAFVPVDANGEATLVVPLTEDQVAVVTVSLDGIEIAEETITHSCEEPEPTVTISVSCDDGAVVTISNTAGVDQTVKVVVDGTVLTEVVVPAGESIDQTIALVEDVATLVEATFGGETIGSETLTLNCESDDPIAMATLDCEANVIVLNLTNPSPDSQVFEVTVDGTLADTVVNAGQTVSVTINIENGSTTDVSVVVDLETILDESILDNCGSTTKKAPELTATLTQSCSSSVATVTLQNTGDADGTYTVTVNGSATVIAVEATSTQTFTFSLVEDASYTVSVTDASDTVSLNQTFTHDCKADTTVKRATELPRTGANGLYTQILIALLLLSLGAMLVDMGKKKQRR